MYVIMLLPSKQPLQVPLLLVLGLDNQLNRIIESCKLTLQLWYWLSHHTAHQNTDTCRSALGQNTKRRSEVADVPSKTPRRIPHPIAEPNADLGPAALSA